MFWSSVFEGASFRIFGGGWIKRSVAELKTDITWYAEESAFLCFCSCSKTLCFQGAQGCFGISSCLKIWDNLSPSVQVLPVGRSVERQRKWRRGWSMWTRCCGYHDIKIASYQNSRDRNEMMGWKCSCAHHWSDIGDRLVEELCGFLRSRFLRQ